jgi:hypothetical protein
VAKMFRKKKMLFRETNKQWKTIRTPLFEKAVKVLSALVKAEGHHAAGDAYAEVIQEHLYKDFKKNIGMNQTESSDWLPGCFRGRYGSDGKPCIDHPEYFRKSNKSFVFVSHYYHAITSESMARIMTFCKENNLEVSISPHSWYYPTRTLLITYEPKKSEQGSNTR